MKKRIKIPFMSLAVLLLLSMLVTCAASGVPVTDVNQAVPGLGASAISAETDIP